MVTCVATATKIYQVLLVLLHLLISVIHVVVELLTFQENLVVHLLKNLIGLLGLKHPLKVKVGLENIFGLLTIAMEQRVKLFPLFFQLSLEAFVVLNKFNLFLLLLQL